MNREPLEIARGELGNAESPAGSNRTKYGRWMGLDGQPWCMSFVQWCFHQAGRPLPCRTGSCSALLRWYRERQPECVKTQPCPGDIVLYRFGHTGIVESVSGDSLTAIEGNTSPGEEGSQSNGGGVFRRTRRRSLAEAYIRPVEEDVMTGKEIYDALNDYLSSQSVPDWARTELGEAVAMGITDGSDPMRLVPRYQAAIMAKRARERG